MDGGALAETTDGSFVSCGALSDGGTTERKHLLLAAFHRTRLNFGFLRVREPIGTNKMQIFGRWGLATAQLSWRPVCGDGGVESSLNDAGD